MVYMNPFEMNVFIWIYH